MLRVGAILLATLAWIGGAQASEQASERILDYRADIEINADASVIVLETIEVQAAGQRIRRGIYRDFPTDYRDRLGNRYRVRFDVLGVTRNGLDEPFHTEPRANGVRIYIGAADRLVDPGRHQYAIRFRTDRQLGFFESHDELYWNVTGNGWQFPIDRARAEVRLPAPVDAGAITAEGYTGAQGSTEQSYRAAVSTGGAVIEATRPLGAGEGFTIAVGWPKGYVAPPAAASRARWVLADNRDLLVAGLGGLLILAYLGWAWARFGRDPREGVIFPQYEPPAGYSPASARFVMKMSYDHRAFTAAILSLAVKGHLAIDEAAGKYALSRRGSAQPLAAGEQALLEALFASSDEVALENANHALLGRARAAHLQSLRRDYQKKYFVTNAVYLAPSLGATMALAFAVHLLDGLRPPVIAVFALVVAAHFLFAYLLRAPTPRGRRLMDQLEGFRTYLEVAEKDELNLRNPPARTPELFEQYLPFALALGVEQEWAEKFASTFARLDAEGSSRYRPAWYGGRFDPLDLGRFTAGVGTSLSTAIASASTAPGSSSGGGGGGSSGGGGGGGGGGGW
jgi:uncharacterized membrane protein YgcG